MHYGPLYWIGAIGSGLIVAYSVWSIQTRRYYPIYPWALIPIAGIAPWPYVNLIGLTVGLLWLAKRYRYDNLGDPMEVTNDTPRA